MIPTAALERCQTYIDCQLKPSGKAVPTLSDAPLKPAITISRQTGSGAHVIAEKLAEYMRLQNPGSTPPWTVFDRNLVEKVLEEHNLPQRLAEYMPEDRVSEIQAIMGELLGLHPPTWTLLHQTTETILHLAQLGHVILVGRGSNVITAKLANVFHVRLIGSLDRRTEYVQNSRGLSHGEAIEFIEKEDKGRERYLRKNFKQDINNPLLYHLIINTDRMDLESAARCVADTVNLWSRQLKRNNRVAGAAYV